VAVAPRASQVLADLGIAVGHQLPQIRKYDPSIGARVLPTSRRGKAVKVETELPMHDGVTHFQHPFTPAARRIIDFGRFPGARCRIRSRTGPTQFPHGFGRAVEAA